MGEVLDRVTMQFFVRGYGAMIAAPVQCDIDGIPKGSHYVRVPIAIGQPNETEMEFFRLIHSLDGEECDNNGIMGPF